MRLPYCMGSKIQVSHTNWGNKSSGRVRHTDVMRMEEMWDTNLTILRNKPCAILRDTSWREALFTRKANRNMSSNYECTWHDYG